MKMMRVGFTFLSALVILTAAAGRSSAVNLLLNGDLDNRPTGANDQLPNSWTLDETTGAGANGSATDLITVNDFAKTGVSTDPGDLGGFVKAFHGDTRPGGPGSVSLHMYQAVAGVPGLTYQFSGWVGAGANYSGLPGLVPGSPTQTRLLIEFDNDTNRANGVLSSAMVDVGPTLTPGTSNSTPEPWNAHLYTVTATAPAGTLFVRGVFEGNNMFNPFTQPSDADPAAFIDDFNLSTAVPEPATIGLSLIGLVGMLGMGRRRG
jgi:hypothetical protein